MQDIAESLIRDRGKEPEIADSDPFPALWSRPRARPYRIDGWLAPQPLQHLTVLLQQRAVLVRGLRDALLAVVENVKAAPHARSICSASRRAFRSPSTRRLCVIARASAGVGSGRGLLLHNARTGRSPGCTSGTGRRSRADPLRGKRATVAIGWKGISGKTRSPANCLARNYIANFPFIAL